MKTEYLTSEAERRYRKSYYEKNKKRILEKKRIKDRKKREERIVLKPLMNVLEEEIIRNMCELDMNVSAVAENVYLHRNTVRYHLQKITEKTGLNPMRFYDLVKLKAMVDNENGKGDALY